MVWPFRLSATESMEVHHGDTASKLPKDGVQRFVWTPTDGRIDNRIY